MSLKKIFAVMLAVSLAAVSFVGCASILRGTNQNVTISSSPAGATVVIYDRNGNVVGQNPTPTVARLKRGAGFFRGARYRIEITSHGYETQTIDVTPSLNGGSYIVGNFFLGGFIGWLIVDPATGAMWTLKPGKIDAQLRESLSFDDSGNLEGIYIVLKEQIPAEIFDSLELVDVH